MPGDRLLHFTRGGRNRGRGIVAIVVMFRSRAANLHNFARIASRDFFFSFLTLGVFLFHIC